jgi:hypothetical protein
MTDEPQALPALLTQIKSEMGAIGKDSLNKQQGFNFRGIDAVVNAAAPALIKAGVVVFPEVLDYDYGVVEVGGKRTPMGHARVTVRYTFHGPAGDSLSGSAPGEAMDSGDKATAKAMSVAYRTFLLQALSLPTNETDPDASTYSRTDTTELQEVAAQVQGAWAQAHDGNLDMNALAQDFALRYGGADIRQAPVEQLRAYLTLPLGEPPVPAPPMPTTADKLARATDDVPNSGQEVPA